MISQQMWCINFTLAVLTFSSFPEQSDSRRLGLGGHVVPSVPEIQEYHHVGRPGLIKHHISFQSRLVLWWESCLGLSRTPTYVPTPYPSTFLPGQMLTGLEMGPCFLQKPPLTLPHRLLGSLHQTYNIPNVEPSNTRFHLVLDLLVCFPQFSSLDCCWDPGGGHTVLAWGPLFWPRCCHTPVWTPVIATSGLHHLHSFQINSHKWTLLVV